MQRQFRCVEQSSEWTPKRCPPLLFSEWTPKRCPPVFSRVAKLKLLFVVQAFSEWTPKRCPPLLFGKIECFIAVARRVPTSISVMFWSDVVHLADELHL